MNVTKHSSKTSLLKELKKQMSDTTVSQVAITLVDENETYELVVFGEGLKEQKVEGE